MNNIVALIGSPKPGKSSSGAIVERMSEILRENIKQYRSMDINKPNWDETDILHAAVLLIVFPLYVDSLPATLLEAMQRLEKATENYTNKLPKVYAICNCGFYDSEQTEIALRIVQNFCDKVGFSFQYGIGIGCGGMIAEDSKNIKAGGTLTNTFKALEVLCTDISKQNNEKKNNVYIKPNIKRSFYHFGGNIGWKMQARKNNEKIDLRAKPHKTS